MKYPKQAGNKNAKKDDPLKKRSFYISDSEWEQYGIEARKTGLTRGQWMRKFCAAAID